ncbi:MAG: MarR family transcriptional regulator [Desulfobacteraceae bacterium]|nr:MarR family transcriptional regulator [Desulfobacteraceae bacterium]
MDKHDQALVMQFLGRFDRLFHRVLNKMNKLEKKPRYYGTDHLLYGSEIHTIEAIGNNPGINITELASLQGVTKGAISQLIQKLEKKNLIIRMKNMNSDKEVFLKLSDIGARAFRAHDDFHAKVFPELVHALKQVDSKTLDNMELILESIEKFCDKAIEEA